jgi:ryanodine receptor 2
MKMKSKSNYIPQPIDTSDIELPKELVALGEQIARNVHEVWSAGRIKEGWTWGEERNDVERTHPCLMPYENLPESEKEYDRNSAFETLRLIIKLGFHIT